MRSKIIMKSFLLSLALLSSIALGLQAQAPAENYGILVRKANHLRVAAKTALEMQASSEFEVANFEIIVCGELVKELGSESSLADAITTARDHGIKINACGISMKKFEVNKEQLEPSIGVTPNGLLRAFELKKAGYYFIDL